MKAYQEQNHYELLEVPHTATFDEIREAYARAMELCDPDSLAAYGTGDPDSVQELRRRLQRAIEVLSDGERRTAYDRSIGVNRDCQEEVAQHSTRPDVAVAYDEQQVGERKPEGKDGLPSGWRANDAERSGNAPSRIEAPVMAEESAIAAAEVAMAQLSAQVSRPRAVEPIRAETKPRAAEIPSDAQLNGELFRRIREGRGMTLQQLADRTRISTRHLENLEADRYEYLPATVYLRGILTSISKELGMDATRVTKGYMELMQQRQS